MNIDKYPLIESINKSTLFLSTELITAINNNYSIEKTHDRAITITDDLISTYKIKLESIKKVNTEYGNLLTKTTEEMIEKFKNMVYSKYFSFKAKKMNKKIYFWFGIDIDLNNILFINKLVTPRELTEEEKTMVESGHCIQIERDFDE